MAALAAGRAGARVILADEDFRLGGRLLAERYEIDGKPGVEWAAQVEAELAALPDVRIMRRTAVTSVFDHGQYARDRARQRSCAAAAGARAAPAALEDRGEARGAGGGRARAHDRVRQQRSPGVMLASAVRTLHQPLRRGAGAAHRGLHQQ